MRGGWWLLGLLLLLIAVEGFRFKLHDAGVLDALERWRERPGAVVITVVEIALLLTAAGLFSTTSGWAAVGWYVAGLVVAALLLWTTHLIMRAPVAKMPEPKAAPAEPDAKGRAPMEREGKGPWWKNLAYVWAHSPGRQLPMHAVRVADGAPEPRAYCGSEYDPGDITGSPIVWTPQGDLRPLTCKTCRTEIAGVSIVKS